MTLDEHPYERLLGALRAHGSAMRQVRTDVMRASCPAHDDRRPSLTVTRRSDRVLVRCFAGCRLSAVVAALGLSVADLFAGPRERTNRRVEVAATYAYCDADGRVVAEKVRLKQPTKAFRWRTPDPRRPEAWRWGLFGACVGLYRAMELVDQRRVLVVEGEKSVDLLDRLGFAATCGPSGASAWSVAWTNALWRGTREVVVLPDADQPGRLHAGRIAAACYGFCPTLPEQPRDDEPWSDVRLQPGDADAVPLVVRLVELPGLRTGEDVHDWLTAHGHTRADLLAVIEATRPWSPDGHQRVRQARRRELWRARKQRQRERERLTLRNAAA